MTAQKFFNTDVRTDLTDIIFERRNKAYGAYILRKHYDERVNKSMLITMSIFLLFFLLAMIFTSHQQPNLAVSTTHEPIVNFGTKLKLPPTNTPQKKITILSKTTTPKTTTDKNNIKVVNQIILPVLKPDSDKDIILKTSGPVAIGTTTTGLLSTTPSQPSDSGGTPAAAPTKPVTYADIMPHFPGGEEALQHYLKKHIQFTSLAKEAGANGKVFISFVIDVDGSVEDIQLVKDKMGYGCAQNAIEVIKNMPAWIPGSTNGQVIPVEMILPITFEHD